MTTRNISSNGLPKLRPGELAALQTNGYAAVLVLNVGGAITFGVSGDPNKYTRDMANKTKRATNVVQMWWAPDAALARKIKAHVEALVCDRRLPRSDAFDLPEKFAVAAVDVAARKIGVKLAALDEVLARGDVVRARHRAKSRTHLTATVVSW